MTAVMCYTADPINICAPLTCDILSQPARRPSLPPPERTDVSWEDYIDAPAKSAPHLGRPVQSKENTKTFKAMIATVSMLRT